jgi:hypothetical protein
MGASDAKSEWTSIRIYARVFLPIRSPEAPSRASRQEVMGALKTRCEKDAVAGPHHRPHVAVALAVAAQGRELIDGVGLDTDQPLALLVEAAS